MKIKKIECKSCSRVFILRLRRGGNYKYCKSCIKILYKFSATGLRYRVVKPKEAPCFSCKKLIKKKNIRSCIFCDNCYKKYFIRTTGTKVSGIDFTRQVVRIRDKHTCQECGRIWQFGERRFDIHHLGGLCGKLSRTYDSSKKLDKLITLCHKCHLNLPEVREKMSNRSSPRPNKPLPINL